MGSDMIDLVNVKKSKSGGKCFPPGFRFHPTDEELVLYYLKRKICRRSLKMDIIGEVDVYKWDPEELPGQSKLKSGDRQWFFFSPRDRRYPNGARSSRATMNGYWKATGKDRTIKRKSSSVGNKKTLVYYQGRAPSGLRTDWVMHEYTMDEEELRRCPYAQDHYVLYKVFKKSGPGPKNGEQYGAPFVEEEWSDDDCLDVENLLVQKLQPIPVNDFKNTQEEEAPLSNDVIEFLNRIIEPEVLPPLPQITEKAKMGLEPELQPLMVEEDFLEMNDLLGPEPQKCSFDSLSEFDFYHEGDAFGSQPFELQPAYMDNLEFGPANSGLVSEVVNHDDDEIQMSYDLWNHDQGESSITTSYQNVSQPSSGVVIEENPGKLEYNVNQCPQTNMDDGTNSWFSSALWSFVDSIPTTPASAAESSALVNRAFERMSSFSKGRNINLAAAVAAVEKRLEKPKPSRSSSSSKGILYFSIVGVLFAIFFVFIGSSIELLGRYITNLLAVINEAAVTDGCDRSTGNLLYTVATKFPANALVHRPKLLEYIVSAKIKTPAQLEAAFTFVTVTGSDNLDINKFEEACGVGIEVSLEDMEHAVDEIFEEKKSAIIEQRYRTNVGDLFAHVRKKLPWADPKIVKQLIDSKLYALLGEKTAADNEKPVKKKKEKPAKVEDKGTTKEAPEAVPSEEELNPYSIFPAPEENYKVHTEVFFSDRPVLRACNSKAILEKHLKTTGGMVLTRFPPEPNGYLHIGHAKAMFVDFGLAKDRDGGCYLRFDDTNPEAEKKEYIDHIEEIVGWMGWKPFKITYTSDYFQDLYDLAVELIRRGCAYVDHQTGDEIKEYREKKMNSPWRDRPISESLKLFNDMKEGRIDEGKATLRMKQDMQSDNGNMYDLIAYRIKFTPHPHAGDKWCIYPSYDYAHCIVDSLENITHSLCTLEFETRRASYYWLLDALSLYQPYVWEYSRLNITNTVMSKRKLNRLVTENYVDGWDDPRLMTLAGLRRRGFTSTAINTFVRGIGITRSDGSMIRLERLEYHVREELNKTASRTMVVLHPLKVVITNLESSSVIDLDAKKWPDAPNDDASSYYKVPFSNVVYIEQTDFRLKDSKDYYGLAPGKTVLLRYAFPIKCTEVVLSEDKTTVAEIRAEYDPDKKTKPKGVLHWVAEPSPGVDPLKVEVRLFDKLFKSENPGELDNWLDDLNPESKVVIPCAYGVPSLKFAEVEDKFQFERLGYFVADKDSTPEKLIFNRIVTLRDTYKPGSK